MKLIPPVANYFRYFRAKNLFGINGPSHLLLGLGCMFLCCSFPFPQEGVGKFLLLAVCSLTAFGLGMKVEDVQVTYFQGIRDEVDIFVTLYGYHLGMLSIGFPLLYFFHLAWWIYILAAIITWVIAFKAHRDF